MLAKPEHEIAYQELVALVRRQTDAHGLTSLEMLAVAANMVGKLVALQDQRKVTPALAMQIVAKNVELWATLKRLRPSCGARGMADRLISPAAGIPLRRGEFRKLCRCRVTVFACARGLPKSRRFPVGTVIVDAINWRACKTAETKALWPDHLTAKDFKRTHGIEPIGTAYWTGWSYEVR